MGNVGNLETGMTWMSIELLSCSTEQKSMINILLLIL